MQIPNNVGLTERDPLYRQLLAYQGKFRHWFRERGPGEFLDRPMQLRRPTGVLHGAGWARVDTMLPSDYRWGLYHVPTGQQQIAFGDHSGKPVWLSVPDEYRKLLLDHVRVQADVENAAIEQSRTLTASAPSAHDLNNLFQFYLEEGRHTWAMVHLLIEHFGHDGLVEAEALLQRMSGDEHHPRLLEAFNHHTEDWLSHFMWCLLADRVGKYQIQAVTQSAFAPLAGAAKFMMFEEPLHITFGVAGLERVLCRSVEATLARDSHDVFAVGAIPLPVVQRYFNYWASKIYDLFGNDESERANELFDHGIRSPRNFAGSEQELVQVDRRRDGAIETCGVPARLATNTVMRRQYIAEVGRIVGRWNEHLARLGVAFSFYLPHERFNRRFGPCRGLPFDVNGQLSAAGAAPFLPDAADTAQLQALMAEPVAAGAAASWLSAPSATLQSLGAQPA